MNQRQRATISRQLPILQHLAKCTDKDCRLFVTSLSNPVIRLIAQIAINVMNKNIAIDDPKAVRSLRRYKKQLLKITRPKTTVQQQRRVLQQKGGFLGALLGVALPLITRAIGGLV